MKTTAKILLVCLSAMAFSACDRQGHRQSPLEVILTWMNIFGQASH